MTSVNLLSGQEKDFSILCFNYLVLSNPRVFQFTKDSKILYVYRKKYFDRNKISLLLKVFLELSMKLFRSCPDSPSKQSSYHRISLNNHIPTQPINNPTNSKADHEPWIETMALLRIGTVSTQGVRNTPLARNEGVLFRNKIKRGRVNAVAQTSFLSWTIFEEVT